MSQKKRPKIPITAVIVSRNSEYSLRVTLESLSDLAEVILYDNDSQDNSPKIAEEFDNVTVLKGAFMGFGATKNFVIESACHDWILALNADEYIDKTLNDSLRIWMLTTTENDIYKVGRISRINLLMGKKMTHGGWKNDSLIRLFNRKSTRFNEALINEFVITDNLTIMDLAGTIYHQAVIHLGQFLTKINSYSEIYNRHPHKKISFFRIVLSAVLTFCKYYIFKLGFMEGWRGFLVAYCNSAAIFFKHAKFYADENMHTNQITELQHPVKYQSQEHQLPDSSHIISES